MPIRENRPAQTVEGVLADIHAGRARVVRDELDPTVKNGPLRKNPLFHIGDRVGTLTITGFVLGAHKGTRAIMMKCDCGADEHLVTSLGNLRSGRTTRCKACAQKTASKWKKEYHRYEAICSDQKHRTRLLNRISACIQRCHNPNAKQFHDYGGRGIQVYEPWRAANGPGNRCPGREDFLAYLLTLDGWDNPDLDLDRIDVNKGYEPGNLRFITRSENAFNKRKIGALQQRVRELEAENAELRAMIKKAA